MKTLLALALLAVTCSHSEALTQLGDSANKPVLPRHLPFAGIGTCGSPKHNKETGHTTVQCLGPKHWLSPGQTIDTMMLLETPYPRDRMVVLVNSTSQMVDDNLRPVPLSELYVHHYGSSFDFVAGSGAELRGSFSRKRLPEPYVQLINGTRAADPMNRMTNIQLINTVGIPDGQAKPCLECWCDHDPWHPLGVTSSPANGLSGPSKDRGDPTHNTTRPGSLAGSLMCCHQCPTTQPLAGPQAYHLQYTVTYRDVEKDEKIIPVNILGYDVVGGSFEYQLTDATGPGTTHTKTFDTTVDAACPQSGPYDIIRCTGHQHFGAQCLSLIDLDNDKTICRTCPEFGTEKGVPGNEEGYVVRIPDDDLAIDGRIYTVQPGTKLRIQSDYDASVPRFGIMGLMLTWTANMPEPCNTFNSGNKSRGHNVGDSQIYLSSPDEAYHVPLYSLTGLPMPHGAVMQGPATSVVRSAGDKAVEMLNEIEGSVKQVIVS
ncbi:hypothetical protein WJX73_006245 [Symbiochloris irregularis]|uniref:Uncharacterized protein n=1 Tax=Symbiochloris irregularis TaxID=706552 RepID=A0AAW1P496_9CHLO